MTIGRSNPPLTGNYPPFTDFLYSRTDCNTTLVSNFDAMQIIIINGNPCSENKVFDSYLAEYQHKLLIAGYTVRILTLREMNLGFCMGCFKCWHTTPGICSIDDDIKHIHQAFINADLIIWASPLIKGFISSLLKRVQERMIPLLHPYVEVVGGEIHHRKRYGHYPDHGLIVEKESDTLSEELQIVQQIQERYALNFRSKLEFILTTDTTVSEAIRETISKFGRGAVLPVEFEPLNRHALTLYNRSLN